MVDVMKIGSIVRLSRPWEHGQEYKDVIGIVEKIDETNLQRGDSCKVRIEDLRNKMCAHFTFTCFKSRFDILKE